MTAQFPPGSKSARSPLSLESSSLPPDGWDNFVLRAKDATFCHLSRWGAALQETFGLEPIFLHASVGGEIHGVLPLFRMPTLGLGHVMISMPFLNYGGPLGSPEVQNALAGLAWENALRGGAKRIELRNRPPLSGDLAPAREKITILLDLPDNPDLLFHDFFRAKLRAQIRRPMKEGMETLFGLDQINAFYDVFSVNMRDLGTPVLPRTFFESISRAFPNLADFGVVYHQGNPVAGGCGFHFRGEFEMTWASSLRTVNRLAPNMLLYWSFMQRCIERGDTVFNFGRCTPGGSTHRFKSQWGGREEALHWVQWPHMAGSEGFEPGKLLRLATKIWTRLPVPLANRIGPILARRIPTF